MIFGYAVGGDIKYLSDNNKRYHLKDFDYKAVDVQVLLSRFKDGKYCQYGLEKSACELCSEEMKSIVAHWPDCDAEMTMMILREMCKGLEMSVSELIDLCPESLINAQEWFKRPEKQKIFGSRKPKVTRKPKSPNNNNFNNFYNIVNQIQLHNFFRNGVCLFSHY